MAENGKYDESAIQVLEGLDAVRKRPGMYIGSTDNRGLHHLVWEIVDNAIDEALAGYCTQIDVILEKDNSITISDNGRGIPTGMHKTGKSTPEVIFSILHAGGKFDSTAYKSSGGLHGVGSSVTNALSKRFKATIYRDKKIHEIEFKNGGKLEKPLTFIANTYKTGTTINFLPDDSIFSNTKFNFSLISERLKESALLNSGLKITLSDLISNRYVEYQFQYGLVEFIKELVDDKKVITDIITINNESKNIIAEIALQYTEDDNEIILGFANNVKTSDGGTHLVGFKSGLIRAINDYAKEQKILKDKAKLDSNDLREGLVAIVTVKIPENLIEYEGQTKSKLGTSDAKTVVEQIVYEFMSYWLIENKVLANKIIENAFNAQKARIAAKQARQAIKSVKGKKNINKLMLGKLTPAQGKKREINELYLVEGDSAGGSAKTGRNRKFQAILPLRGKVINSEKAKLVDLLKNEEIQSIINAIGAGVGKDFDISDINYGKIIIMTDADTDGAHIQTLLLTFFYRHMKDLIVHKKVYIALPPLYKITFNDKSFIYLWDEEELNEFNKTNTKKYEIQRYKGLGEMNADQLWQTTMDPKNRKIIQVTITDGLLAERMFKTLMGDDVEKRKLWIQENVKFTLEDDQIKIIEMEK
ncbi:DNA topoisomerase IV subunit B [Mycoplasma mycoides subsp. mycoides]|uniref:DNA topoisomerase (ATP-hydrolyzing) n=2 Tax=Mycoplasma mycoides subsp. mycoides TaxID=2103 RepID=Q6MT98_MYCMS|nr:DNA topoisomerase IV subunit B [Mycoplasma mycoides]CAE77138.1 DNA TOPOISOMERASE IV SUBUNIT B [Mycoplasma mycoides subsp. mycoides SC str. PG1]ADK69819.1 DNA topoisomerase IV, B subunit [Mycoplasma mycoides subsp. mycoides SC str. Gladysdale]AIZ55371.1 DNA gyrase subunit B [Mycoplasma mycoides subsp. mycoides]AMK56609.1 DNA topoisomerase 4 subunit B [Mycoplasma mycoides subsp. mycoides]KJQ45992.1 DNA topoisomerase IV, B subunit [Mycoplasma mycoides subsp. mycoides]